MSFSRIQNWEFLGLWGDPASQSERKSVLNIYWKDWCWQWNSNIWLMWRNDSFEKTLMLVKIEDGGEGDDRGWDDWMASLTQWTWVWVGSVNWSWTGKPGVLQYMGSQRVRHNWAAELNWGSRYIWAHLMCSWDFLLVNWSDFPG